MRLGFMDPARTRAARLDAGSNDPRPIVGMIGGFFAGGARGTIDGLRAVARPKTLLAVVATSAVGGVMLQNGGVPHDAILHAIPLLGNVAAFADFLRVPAPLPQGDVQAAASIGALVPMFGASVLGIGNGVVGALKGAAAGARST